MPTYYNTHRPCQLYLGDFSGLKSLVFLITKIQPSSSAVPSMIASGSLNLSDFLNSIHDTHSSRIPRNPLNGVFSASMRQMPSRKMRADLGHAGFDQPRPLRLSGSSPSGNFPPRHRRPTFRLKFRAGNQDPHAKTVHDRRNAGTRCKADPHSRSGEEDRSARGC